MSGDYPLLGATEEGVNMDQPSWSQIFMCGCNQYPTATSWLLG
jgi:hypothetical protein